MKKQKQQKNRQRKKKSIKWGLIALVIFCWVLPLTATCGITIYYMSDQINNQLVEKITDAMETATTLSMNELDTMIDSAHMTSYDPTIRKAYKAYERNHIEVNLYSATRSFLKNQYQNDDRLLMTMIAFNGIDDVYYVINNANRRSYSDLADYKANAHEAVKEYASTLDSRIGFYNYNGRIFMVRNLLDNRYKPYAIMIMEINKEVAFNSFSAVIWGTDCTLWLNETPVEIKGGEIAPDSMGITFDPKAEGNIFNKGMSMIYGGKKADHYHMGYAVKIDNEMLMGKLEQFQAILVSVGVMLIPLMFLVIRYFYKNVSYPLGTITEAFAQLENGKLGIRINEELNNREFQYFSKAFNKMSDRLKYQFDCLYMEELALRDAKIMALQSQINPHFLNNTLEIINWEARMAGDMRVSRMIEALSQMLDAAMDRKGRPVVRVSEEMMYVDAYFYIISERFGKRLTVKREIDESLLDCYVPRLVMQPIIENAVEHGVEPMQNGTITIKIYKDMQNLVLEVDNNGKMTPEDEERIEKLLSDDYDAAQENSSNLGIRNVHQRLRIIYGEHSGLSIKMNNFGGTAAKIIIPIEQSKQ